MRKKLIYIGRYPTIRELTIRLPGRRSGLDLLRTLCYCSIHCPRNAVFDKLTVFRINCGFKALLHRVQLRITGAAELCPRFFRIGIDSYPFLGDDFSSLASKLSALFQATLPSLMYLSSLLLE